MADIYPTTFVLCMYMYILSTCESFSVNGQRQAAGANAVVKFIYVFADVIFSLCMCSVHYCKCMVAF